MPLQPTRGLEKQVSSDSSWKALLVWIDWLQWAPAGPAFVLCLQGKGSTSGWLFLSFCIPAVRFLVAATFRQRITDRLRKLGDSLASYPLRDGQEPWSAVFVAVVLPAVLILLVRDHTITSGDSRPAVLTASSLMSEGHCDLSRVAEVYAQLNLFTVAGQTPYFFRPTKTGLYSSYPLGMVPFVLPAAAAARLVGADLARPNIHDRLEKWTAAWVAGLSLGLFFLLALHLAPAKPAWMATLILGTGSAMFTTVGQALWQHGGVIFWALLALLVEFRYRGQPRLTGNLVQGLAFGMMLACRLSAVVFIVPFAVWVLFRAPARALALAAFSGVAFAPWAFLYASLYGNILGPSTEQLAAANWSPLGLISLAAILISPSRGLLIYQPWIPLAGLSLLPSFRSKGARAERVTCPAGWVRFCVCVILLHLALISSWKCWWGGYCWGSRLAAEAVPYLALLCVRPIALLWRKRTGRGLVISLALLSCLMHVPAIYLRSADWNGRVDINYHPERLWSWSDPPFLYPLFR